MTEPKRRQGQRGATPKPICPKCGEYLKRNYTRGNEERKRAYVGMGWSCPSVNCDYIIKDPVEPHKAYKIKKLTAEFMKMHEQLNRLAEQINELEKEE